MEGINDFLSHALYPRSEDSFHRPRVILLKKYGYISIGFGL